MITLVIQLVFQNRAKMTHQEVTNYLIEHLPEGTIVLASGPTKDGEVRLKLDQDALTHEQEDFLHLGTIAQYIDTYQVIKPVPTLEPWQIEAFQKLLETNTKQVEEDRVYTSSSSYGSSLYHLIDKRYDGIQIEQIDTDEKWSKRVNFQSDELPAVLKTLLAWY